MLSEINNNSQLYIQSIAYLIKGLKPRRDNFFFAQNNIDRFALCYASIKLAFYSSSNFFSSAMKLVIIYREIEIFCIVLMILQFSYHEFIS